jgi:pimeloyl-ACP methyl ester carboxylesterase
MALDVLEQMDSGSIETAYFFGYSFGGYIALYLARHAPERISGVCTLATKFVFDSHTVALFTQLSSVDRIRNRQEDLMNQRHPGQDWTRLVSGMADLYRRLGQSPALTDTDLGGIAIPTLTISASNDQLVPWSESLRLACLMPRGHGFTFAGKAHPLDVIPVPFLAAVVGTWLEGVSASQ